MAWERRGNREYYYEKEWINGRCVSTYRGDGPMAELMPQLEEGRRLQKRREQLLEQQRREKLEAIDKEIDSLFEINRYLVDAFFLINGYHQHKRQWRKRRDGGNK